MFNALQATLVTLPELPMTLSLAMPSPIHLREDEEASAGVQEGGHVIPPHTRETLGGWQA